MNDTKLQITFPKSSEDHRLQLVEVNGAVFAILFAPLESLGPINLLCEEWSLVLLAPIKSKTNVIISGINVICLSEIVSEEASVSIHASNQLVQFTNLIKSADAVFDTGERDKFEFNDDPGALLQYYRLFDSIVSTVRNGGPESFSQAQQNVLLSLCALADRIQGKSGNMDLGQVFKVWAIPYLQC